jgi:hypothetical protein
MSTVHDPIAAHRKMHDAAAQRRKEFFENQPEPVQAFPVHYTVSQAAAFIGKSNPYIRKKMDLGELKFFRFGGTGQQFILHDDLMGLIKFDGEDHDQAS